LTKGVHGFILSAITLDWIAQLESPAMIPPFLANGLLPVGLHLSSESEVVARFSEGSFERKQLCETVRTWVQLSRAAGAHRFCLDGSFVTSSPSPNDVDAVVWLGADFSDLVAAGNAAACELAGILLDHSDSHLFAAGNHRDWHDWVDFFSRTRDPNVRKGLVELML
jgi:hypothetical protein